MAIINKKIHPEYFEMVKSGKKKFELRLADFDNQEPRGKPTGYEGGMAR